jgi:predicted TIM-barrel enzyme
MHVLIQEIRALGFSGVINFPTIGRLDGQFRIDLESIGLGFENELQMLELAMEKDLFTMAYVYQEEEAVSVSRLGVDAIVAHMGLTTGGLVGANHPMKMEDAAKRVDSLLEAALDINPKILPFCHGGPIANPSDAEYIIKNTRAQGFVGASSIERLPVEKAVIEAVKQFGDLKVGLEE